MKSIPLSRGLRAVVDNEDANHVSRFRWYADPSPCAVYAKSSQKQSDGSRKSIFLHRMIMNAKPGQIVDHLNGNGLDCRKSNLRFATRAQNAWNRRSTNPFGKGVIKHGSAFRARITVAGLRRHLGIFKTADDAHAAYRLAAASEFNAFTNTAPLIKVAITQPNRNPFGAGITRKGSKFQATVRITGIRKYIGLFSSVIEARRACHTALAAVRA